MVEYPFQHAFGQMMNRCQRVIKLIEHRLIEAAQLILWLTCCQHTIILPIQYKHHLTSG